MSEASRMFSIVGETDNPGRGCRFDCVYCWTLKFRVRSKCELCRKHIPHLHPERLGKKFKPGIIVFEVDMGDIACFEKEWVQQIIEKTVCRNPETLFLFLTKDPRCYHLYEWPENTILGATIETNRDTSFLSKAPHPAIRFEAMMRLDHPNTFLSAEPILDFDPSVFTKLIMAVYPTFGIAVGYDNYHHRLPEPPRAKTESLMSELESLGLTVYRKTIRDAWWEV